MKKGLTLIIFIILLGSASLWAQKTDAKPDNPTKVQYVIHVTQEGKNLGDIVLELFPDVAPLHCANFDSLVTAGFYNGTAFHRVIPGFMIQGGDPNSKNQPRNTWGYGDPSQKTVKAEFNRVSHKRGILSAARSEDINSASSQFFICVADVPRLDGKYTVFGKVISGMETADLIVNSPRDPADNPLQKIEMKIEKVIVQSIDNDNPVKKPAKKSKKK